MAATFTATFSATGTYSWVAPAGVTSASWTCNGSSTFNGGGTGSGAVTAGTSYAVVVVANASVVVTWSMTSPAVIAAATSGGAWTWAAPAGTTSVNAEAWGAGGAGGAGEYAAEPAAAVTPTSAYTFAVGAHGAGVSNAAGTAGGNSTFTGNAVTVTAHGGRAGQNNGTVTVAGGTGSTSTTHHDGGSGGTGSGGHVPPIGGGGGGSSAGPAAAGNAGGNGTSTVGGAAGAAVTGGGPGGAGAAPGSGGTGSVPASGPGGGGGGSSGSGTAIAGAAARDGQVRLTWSEASTAAGSVALAPMAMSVPAFPRTILDLRAHLLLGAWTDVSAYVYGERSKVVVTRGRQPGAQAIAPATADFQLNNRDSRFSCRNPTGPYYGQLGRNTPVRFSVPASGTRYRSEDDNTSYVSCPATAGLELTGDLDIAISLKPSGYARCVLASRWSGGTAASWTWLLLGDGTQQFWWVDSGGTSHYAFSYVPVPLGTVALRVTFQVANGEVAWWSGPGLAGPWAQVGAGQVWGATSLRGGTAPLVAGYDAGWDSADGYKAIQGSVFGFRLLSGVGGAAVASPDFTTATAGAASLTDAQGNVWSVAGTAEFSSRSYRFHGELGSLPQRQDTTGRDVWVPASAASQLRRISQGTPPAQSAMYRYIDSLTGIYAPVAWWPCEDGAGSAGQFASAVPGVQPIRVTGTPKYASDSSFACSQPLPEYNGSMWNATIPRYARGTTNVVSFLLNFNRSASGIVDIFGTGTIVEMNVYVNNNGTGAGDIAVFCLNAAGAVVITDQISSPSFLSQPVLVTVTQSVSGRTVTVSLRVTTLARVTYTSSGSTAGTLGVLTSMLFMPVSGGLPGIVVGHFMVATAVPGTAFPGVAAALAAHAGETAGNRFGRLCYENQIASRIYGFPDVSVPMGVQAPDTLPNLLQSCEDADQGQMFDPREALALGYRTSASICSQAPLGLDYAAAHLSPPFEPADDDQLIRNDITITRAAGTSTGSSARSTITTGTLSVLPPSRGGVGYYSQAYNRNVATDAQLPDAAGWMTHVGTADETRYPVVTLNLARAELASLLAQIQEARMGDYWTAAHPPPNLPPGLIKLLRIGETETMGGKIWTLATNSVPESPYEVAVADDPVFGRADTAGSALNTAIGAADTSMLVSPTAAGPPWTTSAPEFPLDVMMGGEKITVSSIGEWYDTLVPADSPLLWWELADAARAATVADSSGNARTGTPTACFFGAPGFSSGGGDTALFLIGTGHVDSAYNPGPLAAFSVEAWVNLAGYAQAGNPRVVANSDTDVDSKGFQLFLSGLTPRFSVGNGAASGTAQAAGAISGTGWHQLAGTFDGATVRLYVDGVVQATTAALAGTLAAGASNIAAGWNPATATDFVTGLIAQVSVYASVLTGPDIAARFAQGTAQKFTITRSVNGVVKSHLAGEDVRLATPAIAALI